jgi:hypothetical protein
MTITMLDARSAAIMDAMSVRLVTETFDGIDLMGDLQGILNNTADYLVDLKESILNFHPRALWGGIGITENQRKTLLIAIEKANWLNYGGAAMPIPENFVGNISEYYKIMIAWDASIYNDTINFAEQQATILKKIVTSKALREQISPQHEVYDIIEKNITAQKKEVDKYFKSVTGKSFAKVSSILPKRDDAKELVKDQDFLKKDMGLDKLSTISELVKEIDGLVLDLIASHKRKALIGLDNDAIIAIVRGVKGVGSMVERTAIHHYQKELVCMSADRICKKMVEDLIDPSKSWAIL